MEQLDARLRSLDSLCGSWLNEAARREEKLRREQLTRLLHGDISQVRMRQVQLSPPQMLIQSELCDQKFGIRKKDCERMI